MRRHLSRLLLGLIALSAMASATALTAADPAGAIVGGRVAPDGVLNRDWYFYAQLDINGGTCGGVVVSPNSVLTAAHCVDQGVQPNQIDVDLEAVLAPDNNRLTRDVVDIEIAPTWSNGGDLLGTGMDMAMLRLDRPVPRAYVIPLADEDRDPGTIADLAGRGLTAAGGSASADIREARMEILPDSSCFFVNFRSNHRCFGRHSTEDFDGLSCNGDSGGPITVWSQSLRSFVLFALVGNGDCSSVTFGTAIVDNREWVDAQIEENWANVETGDERVEVRDNGDGRYRIVGLGFAPGASVRVLVVRDGELVGYHFGLADDDGTANTSSLILTPSELHVGDELQVGERQRDTDGHYVEADYRVVYQTVHNGPRVGPDVDIRSQGDDYRMVGTRFTPGATLRIAIYRSGVHQGNFFGIADQDGTVDTSALVLSSTELRLGDEIRVGERRRVGNVATGAYSDHDFRTVYSTTFTGVGLDERVEVRDNGDGRYRVVGLGLEPRASVRVLVVRGGVIVGYHYGLVDDDGTANTSALVLTATELDLGDELRVGERRRGAGGSYTEPDYRVVYRTYFNGPAVR